MRFGIGWRAELGAAILANLDRIDAVELLAEEFDESNRRALRFLRRQVSIVVHGTSLGLASTEPVDGKRLDAIARVVEWTEAEFWSEHLAFVRAGGMEIGHLAAPPRNDATLEGLMRNVDAARRVVGSAPLLENVATLIDPPFSTYDEIAWMETVTRATGCDLLLDLHNLHANAVNFGFAPRIPRCRAGAIHIAGGKRIEGDRILDDHLHAVPDEVFALLAEVTADLVILERDGRYPPFAQLLGELDRARDVILSVSEGSVWESEPCRTARPHRSLADAQDDTAPFLAALYTDDDLRARFVADPVTAARGAGLSEHDAEELARMDVEALRLAARSFAKKRAQKRTG